MRSAPSELLEFLAPYPDEVQELALSLRARVLGVVPQFHEVVWDATNAVSCVYTPSTNWQDGIVHVASYSKHVNLGFNEGSGLADPAGVLRGTGTHIRHVTFASIDALSAPWLDDYIAAAARHAGLTGAEGDGGTTVRRSGGPKRRPS